jgi:hypothetical protein
LREQLLCSFQEERTAGVVFCGFCQSECPFSHSVGLNISLLLRFTVSGHLSRHVLSKFSVSVVAPWTKKPLALQR